MPSHKSQALLKIHILMFYRPRCSPSVWKPLTQSYIRTVQPEYLFITKMNVNVFCVANTHLQVRAHTGPQTCVSGHTQTLNKWKWGILTSTPSLALRLSQFSYQWVELTAESELCMQIRCVASAQVSSWRLCVLHSRINLQCWRSNFTSTHRLVIKASAPGNNRNVMCRW